MVFTITNEILMKIRYQIENQKEMDKARRDINNISTPYGLRGSEGKFMSRTAATESLANARKQEKADAEAAKAEKAKLAAQQKSNRAVYGLLGSLFLLAAVSSSIMAMASPAMELAGVFDIISTILLLLFLPAVIYLLPWLLKLLKWVSSLSHESKLFIGIALLVVAAIAIIAGGLIALIIAMTGLAAALGLASGAALVPILLLIAAIVALVAIFAGIFAVIDDWISKHRKEIYEGLGAKTPEEQAKMSAGFAGISKIAPGPDLLFNPLLAPLLAPLAMITAAAGVMAGPSPTGSTSNSWSWSSIINILGGRDNNQPKLDGTTANPY